MRIVAVVPDRGANPRYRAIAPLEEMARQGHAIRVEEGFEMANHRDLADADVVYFWRLFIEPARRLARALRRAGVAVVWDNDDDLTAARKGTHGYRMFGGFSGQRIHRELVAMMRLADVITTPNPLLAERFGELSGRPVRVVENYLLRGFFQPQLLKQEAELVVGWVSGMEHRLDFEALGLRETFQLVLERYRNVHFATLGINFGIEHERYHALPSRDLMDLPDMTRNFDVGLAPIADNAFNRGRSNIKLKEYAAVSVPWLASPIGPYAEMGEQQGGRLVPDDGWCEAIQTLIRDTILRTQLAYAGSRWAKGQTLEKNIGRWEDVFHEAVERARGRVEAAS